jgi:signal transduction histidine kinase
VATEESSRVNSIISHYLKFASSPKLTLTMNKIEDVIQEPLLLLKIDKNISKDIVFSVNFQDQLPLLLFDRDSIKQVFWNLIKNSIESIPDNSKGIIKIDVRNDDEYVVIRISDNGHGISPDNLDKIYEPFYSLKAEGTGLGLSIVKRIIERHHWKIEILSKVYEGTNVIIYAPITPN